MRHFPRQPPIETPVVLWVTGDRATAVHLEITLRRSFTVGLQRLGGDPRARDFVAVLKQLGDCACAAFARYNGKNDRMPDAGASNDTNTYRGSTTSKIRDRRPTN